MRRIILALALVLLALSAQANNNVRVINVATQPIPGLQPIAGALRTENYYSGHITTSATTAVTATTSYVSTVVICVTNAGTGWTIQVKCGDGTFLYSGTAALGTFTPVGVGRPVIATGGVSIITTGTAGVVDVKITYSQ